MTTNPRIKLPDNAKAGEVIEVKTLITHVMETGNRKDKYGKRSRATSSTRSSRSRRQGVPRRVGTGFPPIPTSRFRCACQGRAFSNSPGPTITASRPLRRRH